MRLEIQSYASPALSLNLKTTPTSSELYLEANWIEPSYLNGSCPFWYWSEDNQNGNSNNLTNGSGRELERNETRANDQYELDSRDVSPAPHLSSMIGLSSFSNVDLNKLCRKYKIFETKLESNHLVTRIYKDVLRLFSRVGGTFDTRMKKGRIMDQIFEERFINGSYVHNDVYNDLEYLNLRDGEYVLEHMFSNGDQRFKIFTIWRTNPSEGTNNHFVVTLSKFDNFKTSPTYQDNSDTQSSNITTIIKDIGSIQVDMNEAQPGEVRVLIDKAHPYQTIFDSTIFSSVIYEDAIYLIKEMIPSFAKGKMLVRLNSRLHGILTSSIANAFKLVTMNQGNYYHLLWD